MKKLALLFIGLVGCVHQSSAVVPTKDTVEIIVRHGMMGTQTIVDYKVSMPSNQSVTSPIGQHLAMQLQISAAKKAAEFCEQNGGAGGTLASNTIKQENNELSGRVIVVCVPKEDQEK